MSDQLEQIPPNTVDAREGVAVGEYAIYSVAEIAQLTTQVADLGEIALLAVGYMNKAVEEHFREARKVNPATWHLEFRAAIRAAKERR